MTTTPERKRRKRDIPESKASFVAYKLKTDYKNVGLSRCSLILYNLGIKLARDIFFNDVLD